MCVGMFVSILNVAARESGENPQQETECRMSKQCYHCTTMPHSWNNNLYLIDPIDMIGFWNVEVVTMWLKCREFLHCSVFRKSSGIMITTTFPIKK